MSRSLIETVDSKNNPALTKKWRCSHANTPSVFCPAGTWGVGLATRNEDLNKLPLGQSEKSWVLRSDGTTHHNGQQYAAVENVAFEEGDVLVCFPRPDRCKPFALVSSMLHRDARCSVSSHACRRAHTTTLSCNFIETARTSTAPL